VQGATIYRSGSLRIEQIKFEVPAEMPVPEDFPHGPATHNNCYNPNRDLFSISAKGKEYIVWNDSQKKNIYLTEISR
jgi:hypothetical protein